MAARAHLARGTCVQAMIRPAAAVAPCLRCDTQLRHLTAMPWAARAGWVCGSALEADAKAASTKLAATDAGKCLERLESAAPLPERPLNRVRIASRMGFNRGLPGRRHNVIHHHGNHRRLARLPVSLSADRGPHRPSFRQLTLFLGGAHLRTAADGVALSPRRHGHLDQDDKFLSGHKISEHDLDPISPSLHVKRRQARHVRPVIARDLQHDISSDHLERLSELLVELLHEIARGAHVT